jgi:ComF family protein
MNLRRSLKEMVFPMRCPGCDTVLYLHERKEGFCKKCLPGIVKIEGAICMKCGKTLLDGSKEYCLDCSKINHTFDQNRSLFLYDGVMKEAMYRFKYSNRRCYARNFTDEIRRKLMGYLEDIGYETIDAVIAIPMSRKGEKKRGYNQAEALAHYISREFNIPERRDVIIRNKETQKMKTLDPVERRLNLINAFKYREIGVKLKKILLVDDIYTTGATLDSVALELREHGVSEIYSICICIGSDRE